MMRDHAHRRRSVALLMSTVFAVVAFGTVGPAAASPPAGQKSAAPRPAGPKSAAAEEARLRLATVNGEPISLADLKNAFESRHAGHGSLLIGEEILRAVLDQAIAETLTVQEGRRMGIAEEPGFLQAQEMQRDLLRLQELEERFIRKPAEPTPAQVKQAYDLLPKQIRTSLIETQDKRGAGEALKRVQGGESFGAVARAVSTHASRNRGGDLGWVTWGVIDPVTEAMILKTPAGTIAGPFEAEGVWRLVQAVEIKIGEPPARGKVEDKISAILRMRRQVALRGDLVASVRKNHPPKEEALVVAKFLFAPRSPSDKPDPADDAVLLTTATGLKLTAGRVRSRARGHGGSIAETWEAAVADTLLIDEARRRIAMTPVLERQARAWADARIRGEVEATVILKGVEVGDAEARAVYDRNPAAFAVPSKHHLRQIVVVTAAEAEAIRRDLAAGKDFAELARARSIDTASGPKGGDLGWLDGPRGPAGPSDGVYALKAGETSGVIQGAQGFGIVQVIEVTPGAIPPFDQVRDQVTERLVIQKQKERRAAFVARLKEHAKIQLDETAFRRAVALQDEQTGRRLTPGPAPSKGKTG